MPKSLEPSPEAVAESPAPRKGPLHPFLKSRKFAYIVLLGVALLRAYVGRYSINADGMCYLDLGNAFFHRKWFDALNAYWSPLYAWLVGAALFVLKPSHRAEFPVVHAMNVLIFIGALLCLEYFLAALNEDTERELLAPEAAPLSPWLVRTMGYALFLWASMELITIWDIGADLCVSGFVFLIAGMLVRLRTRSSSGFYLLLGAVLAFAYFTKAVMFPLGFAFILIGLWLVRPPESRLRYLLIVTFSFLMFSSPWIALLSHAKGRFTFSDTGLIAYSAFVSPGGNVMNWRGQPPGSGVPKHPTRKILDDPAVYEFATPVGGTFPPSFDPSYWDDTRSWTFSLRAQLLALKRHFRLYAGLFLRDQPGALTAALTLLLLGGAATRSAIARNWPLIAMCVTPLGLYALVYSEPRYVAGYVVLFWAVIFAGVRLPGSQQILVQYLVLAAVVTVILSVADGTVRSIEARGPYSAREHVDVADGLERIGITSGDRVAVLGDGNWSYWAELDKVKIVTSTEEGEAAVFWSEPRVQRERVYRAFASTGAKAVVGVGPLKNDAEEGWRRIGNTNHYVKILTP